MLITLLYEFFLIVLGIFAFPWMLYQSIFKKKYRKSFLKRLTSGFPLIKKGDRFCIWVHAVSLGETKAIAPLIKLIKAEFPSSLIVFSNVTETGHVEACRSVPADYHVFLPFDFGWIINPIVKRTAPDLVLLCESDFWYNFLHAAKRQGAYIALVNGKISTKSMERFKKGLGFTQGLFDKIDLFCLQSNLFKTRFEQLKIPPEKIVVTGNMKFDGDYARLPPQQLNAWRLELGINKKSPVIVIGSTHHPEEVQLLGVMSHLWKAHPDLKVLLVPRHPERFNEVAGILQKSNIDFRRLSQKTLDAAGAPVILIDAMGLLRKCYQLADIAIVAGSYTAKVGGHNILEPSWYGVPVIFGPHMHTQPDLVDLVKEYGAGLQVKVEDLKETLQELIEDEAKRRKLGSAGLLLSSDVHGATHKTLKVLEKALLAK